jgi:hypothetical protein
VPQRVVATPFVPTSIVPAAPFVPAVNSSDWEPLYDMHSGKTYYHCRKTGETSWTIPLTNQVVSNTFHNDGSFLAQFAKSTKNQKKDDTQKVAGDVKRKRTSDDDVEPNILAKKVKTEKNTT